MFASVFVYYKERESEKERGDRECMCGYIYINIYIHTHIYIYTHIYIFKSRNSCSSKR